MTVNVNADSADSSWKASRLLPYSPQDIFNAHQNPELLAKWWGPKGFTNTFETFEFEVGGRWLFVMHGPNGTDYHNENVFRVLEPGKRLVIEHVPEPWFTLTIELTEQADGTLVSWTQTFESPDVLQRLLGVIRPANEDNFDRLTTVLGGGTP
ncbi:MAG: SRPBCC domain-containing protein [Myxococcales bacterium]|nr:SRPBCC domain-containing protein [Myxococcales bacterium]